MKHPASTAVSLTIALLFSFHLAGAQSGAKRAGLVKGQR
jgi:hypothetical protein